jgi:membrane protease subunit HflC
MRRFAIVILTLVTVAVLFFVLATYQARAYEYVIVSRFGRVILPEQQTHLGYGWYLCSPTDTVVRMDRRLHLYRSKLVERITKTQEPISVQAFAAWQISDPALFYQRFQGSDEKASANLDSTMMGAVSAIMVERSLDDLFGAQGVSTSGPGTADTALSPTEQLERDLTNQVSKTMSEVGIEVVQVGFARLALPPSVASAYYARMVAERYKMAENYRSKGRSDSDEIESQAKSTAEKIRADATLAAAAIRTEGDKTALAILAEAQATPEAREFYQFWRELELLKNSIGRDSYLMLRSDEPISQQLFPKNKTNSGGGK